MKVYPSALFPADTLFPAKAEPHLYSEPDIAIRDWPCKAAAQSHSHRLWLSGRKKGSCWSLCVERIFTQFLRLHKHVAKSFTSDEENRVSPPSQLRFSGCSWTDFSIHLLLALLFYLHLCDWKGSCLTGHKLPVFRDYSLQQGRFDFCPLVPV